MIDEIGGSHIKQNIKKGNILYYTRYEKGGNTPKIFDCLDVDDQWGVVHYMRKDGKIDTIGIAYVRKATFF